VGLVAFGLVAAVFTLGYALWQLRAPVPPSPEPQARVKLALEGDAGGATVNRPYVIVLEVYNESEVAAENVRFMIEKEFLGQFAPLRLAGDTGHWQDAGRWMALRIGAIRPDERRRVPLTVLPRKAGRFELVVRLISEESIYHGMADLPIVVTAEEGSQPSGRRAQG